MRKEGISETKKQLFSFTLHSETTGYYVQIMSQSIPCLFRSRKYGPLKRDSRCRWESSIVHSRLIKVV